MSDMYETLSKSKPCFGKYENWDNSWHCKGCVIQHECAEAKKKEESESG